MPRTLNDAELARIAYCLQDRSLPRAVSETIVAATLRLDPQAGVSGIPAPHRLHKFTTCKQQNDPFPAMIELGTRGWLIQDENGPRLAWAHEIAYRNGQLTEEQFKEMQERIDSLIGPRKQARQPQSLLKSEGNKDQV